jgi:hypothetical protein
MSDFAGNWFTTFGPMSLHQAGAQVTGTYQMGPAACSLQGQVKNGRLVFRYSEPQAQGEGWFDLIRPGKFTGQWRQDGAPRWDVWTGVRGFDGIWQTSFGPMRLFQEANHVTGCYECTGHATIEGQLTGNRLTFTYQEPKVRGEGWFELVPDGERFVGKWHPDGSKKWSEWTGTRVQQAPGVTWLVVLEAHWQVHLQDNEYAFGHMLREFFARVPGVRVRQRFFTSAAGLRKWCQEIMYLAEPAVLVIASHGTAEGLNAYGEIIDGTVLADGLRYADNLRLMHFSACLMMEKGESSPWYQALNASFPISGYTTTVDWAASALTEFLYLDMVLSKGLTPADAAAKLPELLPFSGDKGVAGSPYPAAGFRFLPGKSGQAAKPVKPTKKARAAAKR